MWYEVVLIFIVCRRHVPMSFFSHFYASAPWQALSHRLISFFCRALPLTCSSFFSCARPLHPPPPDRTLILCDVKLITPPPLPLSFALSLALRCETDYSGWLIRWFVVCMLMCARESEDDGMLRDRWKVRHGVQAQASACHFLSALFSTGCVSPVSSVAQYGIIQYLQPGIIRGLHSAITVSLRTLALLITCHTFEFSPTLIFRGGWK